MVRTVLVSALFVAAITGAHAADYAPLDCGRAVSPADRTICANYRLGQQEARTATLFEWATSFVGMGQRGQIQDDQRTFIAAREACGADAACLNDAYTKRISALTEVMNSIMSRGPF